MVENDFAQMVKKELERRGFEVIIASSIEEQRLETDRDNDQDRPSIPNTVFGFSPRRASEPLHGSKDCR